MEFNPLIMNLSGTQSIRFYSTKKLTHVNSKGEAKMVDISNKSITTRQAKAHGYITFSNEFPIQQIKENSNKKGDVLSIARISGIMAIKKTSDLVILCHPLSLTKAEVILEIQDPFTIKVESVVRCEGKTGVEMEALTGVNIALLNVYDMCKAVDKHMKIGNVQVVNKTGGKEDFDLEKSIN
ncbi:Molybdenum cofactor biosynthesis protein C [Wickerhamomyces ciferrii]|uniref:cyclic pyranopterin monophosphate synthase n=1 Tax=Wickerhamomyces ciferrii (strain ATCC 14091 / BCRC 22168 / CBS 111 / JCM 3599 / NBRC 0793 / NRRL Y-1031 F-60-10) TaxID=1206466 RepID=K0KR79_WICCF|nr:Molybdenum cofactor biosynthesis protein C [Wickerhamomyces ciferrii]CCH43764.1 Molybdenum cofactor biosynthesis protein C [Wickerhamomyces ciferrii]